MISRFVFPAILLGALAAHGTEVGYTRSQSSTPSSSDKIRAAFSISSQNRVTASYRTSRDTSGVEDDKSSTLRADYRYRTEGGTGWTLGLKKTDETYFFGGQSLIGKAGFDAAESLRLNFSLEAGDKKSSQSAGDVFTQRSAAVGLDYEISPLVTAGLEFSFSNFSATGPAAQAALADRPALDANVSVYAATLYSRSASVYVEVSAMETLLVGAGLATDTALVGGTRTSTGEIYADWTAADHWTLSLALARGRTDFSTTTSNTGSLGIAYTFD